MIDGIPHLLCRCQYRTALAARKTAGAKGFGAKMSARHDVEDKFVDVWLGIDSGFNDYANASDLSVFISDERIAMDLVSSVPTTDSRSPNPSISSSSSYIGRFDSVVVLSADAAGDGDNAGAPEAPPHHNSSFELGDAKLLVTKNAKAKAARRGKRHKMKDERNRSLEDSPIASSGGMISSTVFTRRTVVLDLARKKIGFGVVVS